METSNESAEIAQKTKRLVRKYINKYGYTKAHALRKANEYIALAQRMREGVVKVEYRNKHGKWTTTHATLKGYDKSYGKFSYDLQFRFHNAETGKKIMVDMKRRIFEPYNPPEQNHQLEP